DPAASTTGCPRRTDARGIGDGSSPVHGPAAPGLEWGAAARLCCGMQMQSTLTCPRCGHQSVETMPRDACRFFHDCGGCGARLKPRPGDCCVFCSYGSVPCP